MSGNPFKIGEKVDGSYEVEKVTTSFINIDTSKLKWRLTDPILGIKVLTLDEILDQIISKDYRNYKVFKENGRIPFVRVNYETGMWGVIFEVGNYPDAGRQWYVHGVTKGYG